jgi:peptidoglycan/LPS O-acetylase OafA/YrhL
MPDSDKKFKLKKCCEYICNLFQLHRFQEIYYKEVLFALMPILVIMFIDAWIIKEYTLDTFVFSFLLSLILYIFLTLYTKGMVLLAHDSLIITLIVLFWLAIKYSYYNDNLDGWVDVMIISLYSILIILLLVNSISKGRMLRLERLKEEKEKADILKKHMHKDVAMIGDKVVKF